LVGEQSKLTESVSVKPVLYPSVLEQQLDQARKVFKKYDINQSGIIEVDDVAAALEETYRAINQNKKFNPQELQSLLSGVSVTDSTITQQDFEQVFLRTKP